MSDLMKLKVKRIIQETPDTVTLEFKKPFLKKIAFKPGQFLTLIMTINGKEERRAYSLSSIDKELSVTVKKVSNGIVSNYINENIKEGDTLKVLPPLGNFVFEANKNKERHIVLLGGGSGITPLMAILKSVLFFELKSKVTLVYANKNKDSIIFKQQLADLQQQFSNRFTLQHILSNADGMPSSLCCRINSETLPDIFKEHEVDITSPKSLFYVCGPENLMKNVSEGLTAIGVAKDVIHTESFSAPQPNNIPDAKHGGTIIAKLPGKDAPIYAHINPKENILAALLRNKQKINFSCGTGVCGSCKCRVTKGEASSTFNLGLSEEDKQNGYILSCVSYPVSDTITVEFD